jgi:cell division protein FtsW (lipid II flippase)
MIDKIKYLIVMSCTFSLFGLLIYSFSNYKDSDSWFIVDIAFLFLSVLIFAFFILIKTDFWRKSDHSSTRE